MNIALIGSGGREHVLCQKIYEPINTSNFKNKSEITLKLNKVLENMIMKNPNQWIWTHDRWK